MSNYLEFVPQNSWALAIEEERSKWRSEMFRFMAEERRFHSRRVNSFLDGMGGGLVKRDEMEETRKQDKEEMRDHLNQELDDLWFEMLKHQEEEDDKLWDDLEAELANHRQWATEEIAKTREEIKNEMKEQQKEETAKMRLEFTNAIAVMRESILEEMEEKQKKKMAEMHEEIKKEVEDKIKEETSFLCRAVEELEKFVRDQFLGMEQFMKSVFPQFLM